MLCFRGFVLALGLAGPAGAQCYICDEVVELDARGADCFLERYDAFRADLETGSDTVEVDLGDCSEGGTGEKSRGGVQMMPGLAPPPQDGLKTVFTFDDAYVTCLRDLIAAEEKFDPTVTFDLAARCQP